MTGIKIKERVKILDGRESPPMEREKETDVCEKKKKKTLSRAALRARGWRRPPMVLMMGSLDKIS